MKPDDAELNRQWVVVELAIANRPTNPYIGVESSERAVDLTQNTFILNLSAIRLSKDLRD